MARLVAVDYDPFESQSAQPRLTPVDYDPFAQPARLTAKASGGAGVEQPNAAWVDEIMGQYTRDRSGIDRLHKEAKAAGVPLGRAVNWKRNQLERENAQGTLKPPTTAPLSLADVDERNVSERAAAIRAAEMIQSSPLATWPNTGANTAIPGEADNSELTSALDVLESYRKKVAPEVPGPQFMRQMLPRATSQEAARDPDGSWGAAGESLLQGVRQSVAGRAQAIGEKARYAGNYVPAIRGLLDAPANLLRTEGYEQGADALGRMRELGAQMAPEPTVSVYDDPAAWARYYGQQGVASSGQTLTGMAAGLANPVLGAAEFLSGAAGSEYGRARIEDNATPSEAGVRALTAAATEGIPEMIGGAAMLGRLPMMKLAQSTARGRAAIAAPVEAGTEWATEKANIELERARGKYISPEEESKRLRDAAVVGGLMGGTMGAGSSAVESGGAGVNNLRETIRQASSAADISSPMAAAFNRAAQQTTARILGPAATPEAAAGAQMADDAFKAAGVGTVAAADIAEQDALERDLDAATRDQLGSEAEIDRLLTGGINAQAQAGSPGTVLDGQDAGRTGAAIPGISGGLPAGVRTSYPGDSGESGSAVGFVGNGSLGSRDAPAPQQFTELANGTVFVPGDPVQLRQRAADAGFDVRGLAETRNGVTGVRFGTGARDQIIGLFGGADPASAVEQSQPSAPPEAAAVIAPPALDAKRTYGDTVFDERAHDLLDFIALNGGLDRTALESEGIDPANWNSRAAKGKNDRFFGKPLFRKSGGMSLETLREKARDAGFRTDKDVLDLIGDSLGGRKTFTPAGSEYQMALADVARQEADAQARQQRVNALPPSVPETDADAYIASRETEFDAPADRDGIDLADIESTLASVADTSPQQRASVVSLGHDYTAKLIELKRARAAGALNPDQQEAYIDLLEQDRETGKVAGRPMVGIGNKSAYVDAQMQGKLMPVQVFLDADNFKALNDKFGHDVGDDAIRLIADVVRAEFGDGNVFHRGGDEFLTQGMTQDEVDAKMARVQSVLANYAVDLPLSDGRTATLPGIGVSYGTGANEKAADDSLKQDKQRRKEAGLRFDRREGDGVGRVGSGTDGARTDASGTDANPQDRSGAAAEGVGDVQAARKVGAADSVAAGEDGGSDGRVAGRVPAGPVQPLVQAGRGTVQSIRTAISQALGPKFLARLDNQKWFQIVDSVADLPPDVRKSITGEGVAGFVLPDGRVFIVAEGAAANPVGVTLHELGVHYGMTGILGEDFAPTLAKFKRLRAKDDRVGRAYERATEAADKDKNGDLTEAARATLDEEALAYFVEENWDSPDTRGIVAKVIDAIKRLLNRVGIPMSWINASPELLREVAIGAARMAADGRITVGKDGALVYARDLLGEAPSETAQLVAQWKAKVDAKLRGDGRAYVKPSEGPGDLFGGPAEETADLFAKPQQRAQGTLFSRKRDNSTAAEDRALDSGDLEGAVRIRNRRIAEQREALGDISNGVILKMEGRDSWAIVMPDVEGGGKWRMQMFDRRGFVGHRTRNSRDAALDEALQDKYTTRDDGALDEIQDSPEFVRGNFIAGEMMQLNAGKITSDEFDKRIADYDSSVKVVAKYSRTTQTGRIRKTVAELTNAADSMGSWRDWYDRHDQTLRDVFGDDAELFQKLLSATSQAASVPANIGLALKAYRQMFSGEPFVGYLPAVIKNLERVAENVALRGQKISEYGSANEGNADAIAVDRHIAMLFFGTKSPNRKQVAAAKNRIRAIAERLGWQPREVQAALWAYNQTLLGTAPEDVKSYDKLIEASRARIDALRASIGRGEDRGARETGGTDGRAGAPERDAETGREQARAEVGPKYSRKAEGGSEVPESDKLVALHNVSPEGLLFADRIGGLAVPSIGITKAATPFTGFGSVTLIGSRDLATPSGGNPVFSADAFTQRFPDLEWPAVPEKKVSALLSSLDPDWRRRDTDSVHDAMVNKPDRDKAFEEARRSVGFMRAWLAENGEQVADVVEKNRPHSRTQWAAMPAWLDAVDSMRERGIDVRNLRPDDAEWADLSSAAIAAIEQDAEQGSAGNKALRKELIDYGMEQIEGGSLSFGDADRAIRFALNRNAEPRIDKYATRGAMQEKISARQPQFDAWVVAKINPLFGEPSIRIGRKKAPMTLDNIVEAMTRGDVAGKENTMTFASGKAKAMNAKQYRTIEEIQADRERIVSPEDERTALSVTDKLLDDYRTEALESFSETRDGRIDTWAGLDAATKALADAGKKAATPANMRSALVRNGFRNPSPDAVRLGVESLIALRETVTDYFEAKPQRAVKLSEFAGAVVRESEADQVRPVLEKHGVEVREYSGEDAERRVAIDEFTKELEASRGRIRFSRRAPTININGTERPTTDSTGKAIHPTEEGLRNFWAWFGDGSANRDGEPIPYIHSSSNAVAPIPSVDSKFGGVFAVESKSVQYGDFDHAFFVRGRIADTSDLRDASDAARKVAARMFGLRGRAAEVAAESALSEADPSPEFSRIVRAVDEADAYTEMQRLRGEIARDLGFSAVWMHDETGRSLLMLSGDDAKTARQANGEDEHKEQKAERTVYKPPKVDEAARAEALRQSADKAKSEADARKAAADARNAARALKDAKDDLADAVDALYSKYGAVTAEDYMAETPEGRAEYRINPDVADRIARAESALRKLEEPKPTDKRIAYSRKIPRTAEQSAALAKAGMPEDNRTLIQRGKDYLAAQWANVKELASSNITQSVFDRFHRMSAIEQDLGIPAERSAYLSARLAAGLPSIMEGLMMYAAPKWEGGVLTVDDTTVGLLDALKPVKDDINGWLGWMVGRRAKALKAQGRENLMTDTDIDALLSLSAGKEAAFKDAALKYLRIKKAVLDVAEQAGLIDPVGRASWDSVEYIPFYRQDETEGDTIGPGTRQGLSKQSSGIQKLKGGQQNLADPLGNIVRNFTRLIDASLKNNAMLEAVKEYGPTFFEKVPMSGSFERIAMSQVKKVLLDRGVPQSLIDAMPQDTLVGLTKLWAVKPPTDDDVVRVMRDGKPEYYRVPDKDLLASLTAFKVPSMHWALSPFKFFKKLLTVGVTSSPEFMARNFVRDSLSSWVISDDKFRVGWDSVKGIISPLLDKTTQKEMMFAGGSFIGGQFYSVGSEEATADALRRALRDKGLKSKDVEQFVGTIARTPLELWDKWQKVGSYFENANRNAIYENAIKAGRSKKEAAYLARDLMDFSMHGNSQLIQFLSDVLPFFNARLQGLYKLYRQGGKKALRKALLMRAGTVVAGTLSLMAWNMMMFADGYDELEEWDKDTYWHIMPGTAWHTRVPKPFELGVLFATVPERLVRAVTYQVPGGDAGDRPRQTLDSFLTQVGGTLAMNPIPQGVMPIVEQWANKTFFTGRPIENMGDEKLLPEARAEWYTSDTARVVSDVIGNKTGLSPKRIEHLWNGYTGTVGAYALDTVDWLVRSIEQKPERPELAWAEMPLLKAFYRGDMVPKSTRYSTEFYEMALKTEQISNTIKDYEVAGQRDKAKALEEKHADLLGSRKPSKQAKAGFMHTNVQMLNKAKDELAEIRKQIEGIVGMPGFSAEQKREKIELLAQKRNKIARDITVALRRTGTSSR